MNIPTSTSILGRKWGLPILSAALLASAGSISSVTAGSPVYTAEILADAPVAYFQFDETTGTIAADSAGHLSGPFDGTYTGAVTLGAIGAQPNLGTAADLAGGFVEVPPIGSFQDSTIEAWIQLDALAGGCCTSLASAGQWASTALHWNLKSDFVFEHAVNGQGNSNTLPGTVVTDGTTWFHIVVTQDAGETTTYIDGAAVADNGINHAGPIAFGNTNFQIGAWNGARLLDGRIDEFAIYDSALSAERVQAHFDAASAVGGADTDGDGLSDEWETENGLDPNDDGTIGESAPGAKDGPNGADGDPDADGLSNRDEFVRGTDPQDDDSDDDSLTDGDEVNIHGSNPKSDDSDGDGLKDGDEVNIHGTSPVRTDSDGDGLDDGAEVNTHGTKPNNPDSDGDGFSDGFEINTLLSDPNDPGDPPVATGGDTPYSKAVLADNPVAYYRFEEANGTVASDSSTSAKHGTYTGSIGLAAASFHANLGSAADFTGGHIEVPNTGSYDDSTVEVWLQMDALAGGCCTSIASAGSWSARALHWNLKSDFAFEHAVNGQGNSNSTSNAFVTDGSTWYHLVVTQEAGDTTTYVNGVAVLDNGVNHAGPIEFGNSNFQIGAWNGARLLDGRMDEFAVYGEALTAEQVLAHYEAATAEGASLFPIHVSHDAGTDMLTISWDSKSGSLYNLRSETDPAAAEPGSWPIFGGIEDMVATPPMNSLTFPHPADSTRLFVVEEFPAPPESIYFDDLEGDVDDWTTGSDGLAGTEWEWGAPSVVGPPAPYSLASCFGTNLADNYTEDINVWLRSPAIDLTLAGGATLNFYQFKDIELPAPPIFFDFGTITVLDASDDSELAVVESDITGLTADWELFSKSLPPAALGKVIKIEFRLEADDFMQFAGWYLDDIEVTVP